MNQQGKQNRGTGTRIEQRFPKPVISYVPENAEIGEIFWRNFDYLVSDLTAGKKVDLKKACEKIKQEVDKLLVKAGYVMNTQTS